MAAGAGELFARDLLRFHLSLDRFDEGMARRYYNALRDLEKDVVSQIEALERAAPSRRALVSVRNREQRLRAILDGIERAREAKGRELAEATRIEAKEIARLAGNVAGKAINSALGANFVHPRLPITLAQSLFETENVGGRRVVDLLSSFVDNHAAQLNSVVRRGIMQGASIERMARELGGALDKPVARRHLRAVVRTATNGVANNAYHHVYRNSKVVEGVQQISVLDTATTPVCALRHQLVWLFPGFNPKDHDTPYDGPPPHHVGCRSIDVAYFYDPKDLPRDLRDKIPQRRQAAMGNRVISGQTDFTQWLRGESEAKQLEWLGRTRYDLWRQYPEMTIKDIVNRTGGKLPVSELAKKFA